MNAAIIARLGLDSGDFKKGLIEAANNVEGASNRMTTAHQKRGAAAEGVWERVKKVENQMVGLAQNLAHAGTAAEATTATMTALAESLNLPLSGAIAAGAGIAIATQLNAAAERADLLQENLQKAIVAGEGLGQVNGIAIMHQGLGEIAKQIEAIQRESKGLAAIWDFMNEGFEDMGANGPGDTVAAKRQALINKGKEEMHRLIMQIAGAEHEVANIQEMILKGDDEGAALARVRLEYEQKIAAARREGEAQGHTEGDTAAVLLALRRQLVNEETKIRQEAATKRQAAEVAECEAYLKEREAADKQLTQGRQQAISDLAAEQAKAAADALEGDLKNADTLADRRADLDVKLREEAMKAEKAMLDRVMANDRERAAADLKNRLETIDAANARDAEQATEDFIDAKLDPAGALADERADRKEKSLGRRAQREAALRDRGGKSQFDVDTENQPPLSERVKPKTFANPKTHPDRAEELMDPQELPPRADVAADPAPKGGGEGGRGMTLEDFTSALNQCDMKTSLENIETNLQGPTLS